ncbi:hypothetical protein QUB28_03640 [Microcoleus sp. B4-C3]|uniref:hypothetical protein n=1 Tax=Microcoleus sp. B4-C2 TaxID=2818661 RepID=UPI002FCF3792
MPVPHKYHFYEQARCVYPCQNPCRAFFILLDNFSAGDRTSNVKCLKAVFVK